jgi:hypothetical protein
MANKRTEVKHEITLEGVKMIWKNFAGEKKLFNESGKRNFAIPLDEDLALELRQVGWNVKDNQKKVDRGEADELLYHLPVTVKMDGKRPPRIFMIAKKWSAAEKREIVTRTQLDDVTVMLLDYAELDNVDVTIRPFNYDVNGSQGVAAYLKLLFAELHQDDLEKKYAHIPIEDETQLAIEAGDGILDVEGEWEEDEELTELDIQDRNMLGRRLALGRGNS